MENQLVIKFTNLDWWTLGIIIYEMLAGIDPFNDDDPMAIYQKILKGKVKFARSFDMYIYQIEY